MSRADAEGVAPVANTAGADPVIVGMEVLIEDVRFSYPSGVEAVKGVSLSIRPGERVAIVGQNGAGKTTLVRQLNGIFRPTSGRVQVGDWITSEHTIAELATRVGYVFQNPDEQLFARTVRADVEFGPRNLGLDSAQVARRAETAIEAVGLSGVADLHPHHLSLSERKRVALAGVVAMGTPVVVLDEPTTGQDAAGVDMIAQVVAALTDAGRTVIAITHDMEFCAEHFDRVIVMAGGQVLVDGHPRDVFVRDAELDAAAVEPPQLTRLARALGWDDQPLSAEEFVGAFARRGAHS
ncbi:energy-coupling factor ABC transporter ATP-binding protein [Ruicaihuangia caeni]|uniref:ABC transporter ATP-binding protein n=1 Tax=Ruicaihuangia caeni TaxID=3042517 RepID=A0AAW6T7U2_9MICO|nr:ABC transporter ATP-binding protein [Klugiella sp. YN-L-19]MDI2099294.1 ABC transporter ATP-binding protein [Klugiella sp. YN-L-19]